jgi:hypothetical protein
LSESGEKGQRNYHPVKTLRNYALSSAFEKKKLALIKERMKKCEITFE